MGKKESVLAHSRLLEILDYNPVTGLFVWKVKMARWLAAGALAGHSTSSGYVTIGIEGRSYKAHRLAWFYVHRKWPRGLDHKDGCGSNNRISNLREATQAQNMMNRPYKSSLPRGVVKNGKRFGARINVDKNTIWLGTFHTIAEAEAVYIEASLKHHGVFSIFSR